MTEGYNRDWTNWDAYVSHLWPKPENVKYRNWYPFLSPKGRWLAFYNKSYTDINIIDLETKELVVRDFYSRYRGYDLIDGKRVSMEGHVYNGGHCNVSTYVPHCVYTQFVSSSADNKWLFSGLEDFDFDVFDPAKTDEYMSNKNSGFKHHTDKRVLTSVPIAFNAYTYWAADFEFYVDLIDLSEVDNGVIKMIDGGRFTIPRSAEHVRNYVNCSFEGEDDPSKPQRISLRYNVLEEKGPFNFDKNDVNNESGLETWDGKWNKVKHTEFLPWQEVEKLDKEREANKKLKEKDNVQDTDT